MPTKSITLSDDEAADLDELIAATGEPEAVTLKRAALRGLKQLRIEQGLLAYLDGSASDDAAAIAGLPRAVFLATVADRGLPMLAGPSTLAAELEFLAARLGSQRLAAAAGTLTDRQN